jgi:hypothetical protein
MMFLGAFFQFPVRVCWNVLQSDRRHFSKPVTVPSWLSIFTPEVGEKVAIVVSPTR